MTRTAITSATPLAHGSDAPHLIILGIRGIPAAHGGFETFVERLAPWLRDHGWRVTVYCQGSASGREEEDDWNGIRRVHIPVRLSGAAGTIEFDIKATASALRRPGMILTLGYNTGFLCIWTWLKRRINIVNMDGLEWKRAKYGLFSRVYLWVNERLAAWFASRLIADHPAIADHLATRVDRRRITIIPYGSNEIAVADAALLGPLGLEPGRFVTLIARPEPENSVLELVSAFSATPRGVQLALLGSYDAANPYQAKVMAAAGPEVVFTGAIYDQPTVAALRQHGLAYLHGHTVGGTNPSLVEALGAGNPIVARDNRFNRWVAGDAGLYFDGTSDCAAAITQVLTDPALRQRLATAAHRRWQADFTWPHILDQYRVLLERSPRRRSS